MSNTGGLTKTLTQTAAAKPDYDTKPLLKGLREDLTQLMAAFAQSRADDEAFRTGIRSEVV